MTEPEDAAKGRLAREIEHHRQIAERAEIIWNWDSPAGRRRVDRRVALFIEHARLGPGRRALEVGCGTGLFLEKVAQCGATIQGLDLSKVLLAKAQTRLAKVGNVALELGNAEAMPHPEGSFDAVYGSSVLHHLGLEAALLEIHRVLKPGGHMAFTEPNIFNPQNALLFKIGPTKQYFGMSEDEMAFSRFHARRALVKAGFAEVGVTPIDFLHPSTPAVCVNTVARLGLVLESLPIVREISGSLLLTARRPQGGFRQQ